MELRRTHGKDMYSWYRHGLMVLTWTYGIDMDSWYRHGLMVVTTPMVLTKTHGILLVLLKHMRTRGPSVAHMRDFECVVCSVQSVVLHNQCSDNIMCAKCILVWQDGPLGFMSEQGLLSWSIYIQSSFSKIIVLVCLYYNYFE